MIIKRGYHRLKTSEGRVVEGPLVVELAEDDSFLSYHLLKKEEEATEWVGGEILIDNSNSPKDHLD